MTRFRPTRPRNGSPAALALAPLLAATPPPHPPPPLTLLLATALSFVAPSLQAGDWPMLHANPRHDGYSPAETITPPYHLAWVRHFPGDRLGTAMEPIVAGKQVFIATHGGMIHALAADDARPLWRFANDQPFLHSPAWNHGLLVAADAAGRLFGLHADTGKPAWTLADDSGGFAAAPAIEDGMVLIGSRSGRFLAVDLPSGQLRWRVELGAPIRQTAAAAETRVFITTEDLRVHALALRDGSRLWSSTPLAGQSARDYYPILVGSGTNAQLLIRTSPALAIDKRIAADRSALARNAGIDDRDWRHLDAWIKSEAAHGKPDLWQKEQAAISRHLQQDPQAQTFHRLDPANGRVLPPPPVLWVGGCQGVGVPPALTSDGRLLLMHRSAYGNWSLGVAPLVALGLLDLTSNQITPLFHRHGNQPPWNTFWGTADEAQNLAVAGQTALLVHQGTLSAFHLTHHTLEPLWGERDTFGGFHPHPWARNEWHGPARGAAAVSGNRIFWLTGSRLLCLTPGPRRPPPPDLPLPDDTVPVAAAPRSSPRTRDQIRSQLRDAVQELLSARWAPLCVEPGLAGRQFFFSSSGETFAALARAFPHLPEPDQQSIRRALASEWIQYPPFSAASAYPLAAGRRREWHAVPTNSLARLDSDPPPHPFGNLPAVLLYASKLDEWSRVTNAWPQLLGSFQSFTATRWGLDGTKGDLHANRYLAALLGFAYLAERLDQPQAAREARALADATTAQLWKWWQRAAENPGLTSLKGSAELDPFIAQGNALSFRLFPHRHKPALLHDLTPQVVAQLKEFDPEPYQRVWQHFRLLHPTWHLVGEERQVHYGENAIDTPDLAFDAFRALAWLREAPGEELARCVDLPFCRADLFYISKLAIALDRLP